MKFIPILFFLIVVSFSSAKDLPIIPIKFEKIERVEKGVRFTLPIEYESLSDDEFFTKSARAVSVQLMFFKQRKQIPDGNYSFYRKGRVVTCLRE
jgi:hypothetical protein